MAAVRRRNFEVEIFNSQSLQRYVLQLYVIALNFVEMGQTVAEISHFLRFSSEM